MPIEITCSLIALAGVVLSAVISFKASKSIAAKEIEKMKLEWERQDIVSSDDEFAEMSAAVATLIQHQVITNLRDAAARVAAVRSKENGALAEKLDGLYKTLNTPLNNQEINAALTEVIKEKRKKKSKQ